MSRSFLPFTLVSLGFTVILLAIAMPLFEWSISNVITDFSPDYEVHIFPSPWKARFGESFDNLYLYKNISVLKNRKECYNENIDLVVKRSQNDESFEQVWLNIYKKISWLFGWSLVEIVLSLLYMWWVIVWYKHQSYWKAIGLTILAVFIILNLIPRLVGPLFPYTFPGTVNCNNGTITFSASLSKIHFETPTILFMGILAEFGALLIMMRQIIKSIVDRNKATD